MSNSINREHFETNYIPEPMSGCWLWLARHDRDGYGRWQCGGIQLAHRAAWHLFRGDPGRLHVLHRCDNPPCVNPDHLFLGTNLDNIQDRKRKGRGKGFAAGQANPAAKLSSDMVLAILAESGQGASGAALARKYGISESTASRIINRLLWKEGPT